MNERLPFSPDQPDRHGQPNTVHVLHSCMLWWVLQSIGRSDSDTRSSAVLRRAARATGGVDEFYPDDVNEEAWHARLSSRLQSAEEYGEYAYANANANASLSSVIY